MLSGFEVEDHRQKVEFHFNRWLHLTAHERETIEGAFQQWDSPLHGYAHWVRVAILGRAMAGLWCENHRYPQGEIFRDVEIIRYGVTTAAFFHDCMREGEGSEKGHGAAGAATWRAFASRRGYDPRWIEYVAEAINKHDFLQPGEGIQAGTLDICFANADRLDRVRFGEEPDPAKMYGDEWKELLPMAKALLSRGRSTG